ncbi:hypothetical protein UFOVP153_29 [uncultured Caudovirales phage]|uniref:Uncharacterized protein n=1 Tax=uncultured Caudovirales phage TaxID=2100421 RepID=A0A6J5L2J3_9CAUD|nr:hypothetical protein UFOVP69_29 [uncultured Caudovirales phage]CAB5170591.1 hypothetical protein UFOVP153_29 [uncultured Caudovirales phage]
MRLGTYIDTLELENEFLREKVKSLEHKIKILENEIRNNNFNNSLLTVRNMDLPSKENQQIR